MHNRHGKESSGKDLYEMTDAYVPGIAYVGAALAVMALFAFVFGYAVLRWNLGREAATDFRPSELTLQQKPELRDLVLQVNPGAGLATFREDQLEKYPLGQISEDPEIYRISIDKAMDIVAEKGFPDFTKLGLSSLGGTRSRASADEVELVPPLVQPEETGGATEH